MKAGLPKPVAMEGSVVFSALQEVLFLQGDAPQVGGGGSWSSQLGVKTQKQHTAEQQVWGWLVGLVGRVVCFLVVDRRWRCLALLCLLTY